MSLQSEQNGGDLKDFKWGPKRGVGVKNKAIQFYESFVYEGVKYSLYDCAYFYVTHHLETSIGKLVRMYEGPSHNKMVKVVWFLRPSEIRNFMGHYRPSWNELFLASGVGKGVSNVNYLGAIIGKCNVVCTSKDRRNPEPSETDLKKADYFFDHAFDVGKLELVDKFADKIDGIEVEHFFNRKGDKEISNDLHVGTNSRKIVTKTRTDPSDILPCRVKDKAEAIPPNIVLPEKSSNFFPYKKRKLEEENPAISPSSKSPKEEEFNEKEAELIQDKTDETCSKAIEVTERPGAERRKWFKKMPWEERLQRAEELNTLVLLDNLDPSFTSSEVEDLVWHAFQGKVEARMIEQSPSSNPYYGRALVIFKTKDAAKSAIFELKKRCLVLGDGRVVYAEKGTLTLTEPEPCKKGEFPGHVVLNRFARQRQRPEMRNAVSTSHCAQPNTVEYPLGIEWMVQYEKSDAGWNALHQVQMKEIEDAKSQLKNRHHFFLEAS